MSYRNYEEDANRYRSPASRIVGIVFVVILHIVIVGALLYALGTRAIEVIRGPIQVTHIDEPKTVDKPPPPPPPNFKEPPPPFVPPPEINISTPAPTNTTAPTTTTVKPVESPPPPPPPAPAAKVTVAPRVDPSHPPVVGESDYPAVSKRLGEEGVVVLTLTVDPDGHVSAAVVKKSSGVKRLDDAAITLALAKFRFLPGTVDGVAARLTIDAPVRYRLND